MGKTDRNTVLKTMVMMVTMAQARLLGLLEPSLRH
jgi:hypothetical protein